MLTTKLIARAGGVDRIEHFRQTHGRLDAPSVAFEAALSWDDVDPQDKGPGITEQVDYWLALACACEILGDEPVTVSRLSLTPFERAVRDALKAPLQARVATRADRMPWPEDDVDEDHVCGLCGIRYAAADATACSSCA